MDPNAQGFKGSRAWAVIKKHHREMNKAYNVYYSPGVATNPLTQMPRLTPTSSVERPALDLSTYSVSSRPTTSGTFATYKAIQEEADDSGYASEELSDLEDLPVSPTSLAPYTWQMQHEKQRRASNRKFSWTPNLNYEYVAERSKSMHHLGSTDFLDISPARENSWNRASFRAPVGRKSSTLMHPSPPQSEDEGDDDDEDEIVYKPTHKRRSSTTLHPSEACAQVENYNKYKTILSVPPMSQNIKAVVMSPEPLVETHRRKSSVLHSALSDDEDDDWLSGL